MRNILPSIEVMKCLGTLSLSLALLAVSSVLSAGDAHALFEGLTSAGGDIFMGMRDIIFGVAGFGIFAVAIGGFFGNLNWKWLSALIIGLVIIATTAGILKYMVGAGEDVSIGGITDTLK